MGVLAPVIFALAIIGFIILIVMRARKEQD